MATVWVLATIAGVSAVVAIILICCYYCWWKQRKEEDRLTRNDSVDLKAMKESVIEYTTEHILNPISSGVQNRLRATPSVDSLNVIEYMRSDDGENADGHCEDDLPDELAAGKIFFRLEYDFRTRDLIVSVVECRLVGKSDRPTVDAYVKVCILPNRKVEHQTKALKKTLNPRFDETIVFHGVNFALIREYSVRFEVFDYRKFSRDDKIGYLEMPLDKVDLTETRELWYHLKAPEENVEDVGEILFSLCYLPTAGRLNVTLMKARNVKARNLDENSDQYAKVTLLVDKKRVKKKKSCVKKSSPDPVWNESYQFELQKEKLDKAVAVISIVEYDPRSRDECRSQVEVGAGCKSQGGQHWREMLDLPRRQVTKWHSLSPYTTTKKE